MNTLNRSQKPLVSIPTKLNLPKAKVRLLNNQTRIHIFDDGTEEVVRIDFVFGASTWHQSQLLVARSTLRLLREGTQTFDSQSLAEKLDGYGAYISSGNSHHTSTFTLYCLNRYLPELLPVVCEILYQPTFPADELENLKTRWIEEYKTESEKVRILASRALNKAIFGIHHPYGVQICEDDFKHLETRMLKDFHNKWYHPNNLNIYVSGYANEATIAEIEKHFGYQIPSVLPEIKQYTPETATKTRINIEKKGAVQAGIRTGALTISRHHPDFPALSVVNMLLGGYFGSRLMKNIREDKGYTYGISSGIIPYKETGLWTIQTEASADYVENVLEEINKEIVTLCNEPVALSELEAATRYMSGELLRSFDGPFAAAESYRALYEQNLDFAYYDRVLNELQTISPDRIADLATKYLKNAKQITIVAG